MFDDTFVNALSGYIAKGFAVTPLVANGKKPYLQSWQDRPIRTIAEFLELSQGPHDNIGIITGKPSGIIVIDVDVKAEESGLDTVLKWERQYGVVKTARVRTPSGGLHFYFRYPGNYQRVPNKVRLYPGIDIRGDGGQVVAPPSTVNDIPYEWEDPGTISSLPDWLEKLIFSATPQRRQYHESVGEGGRNDFIFQHACQLARSMPGESVLEICLFKNQTVCCPPLSSREVEQAVRQAVSYAEGDPDLTDVGAAKWFAHKHQETARYCKTKQVWYLWNGRYWAPDLADKVMLLAETAAESFPLPTDPQKQAEALRFRSKSKSVQRLRAALELAGPRLSVRLEELDTRRDLLRVENALLSLSAMRDIENSPDFLITKQAPVVYDPSAQCPVFLSFLETVFAKDAEVIAYVQRILGYLLTGETVEQCMFIFLGAGRNGKSTLLEVIRNLVGDYAATANQDTFLTRNTGSIRSDIARLAGKRVVLVSEISGNQYLDEALLKNITGGENITARLLYQNEIEFRPQFKLLMATNELPRISGTDDGIWRRIKIVKFPIKIPESDIDHNLMAKLKNELPGILNFALKGAAQWRQLGTLMEPESVRSAVDGYRSNMDDVQQFIDEKCVVAKEMSEGSLRLFEAYTAWASEAGQPPCGRDKFLSALKSKGFEKRRQRPPGGQNAQTVFLGLKLDSRQPCEAAF
jgi:putative DNA primase/helicase